MNTDKINTRLHELAESIREYVVTQIETWQKVPYWSLEAEGRGGWLDNAHIPYTHGLHRIYPSWPPRTWVELATGRIVCQEGDVLIDAPDSMVVEAYIQAANELDASEVLKSRVDRATNGNDTFNKERNDEERTRIRERHDVPTVWTTPAKPICWSYSP